VSFFKKTVAETPSPSELDEQPPQPPQPRSALRELPEPVEEPIPRSPKVGDRVYYFDLHGAYDRGRGQRPRVTPKAAIVTHVYEDGCVDLTVFFPGRDNPRQYVHVFQVKDDHKNTRWDFA